MDTSVFPQQCMTSGSALLLLQIFNVTLPRCEDNIPDQRDYVDQILKFVGNRDQCWENVIVQKLREEGAKIEDLSQYFHQNYPIIENLENQLKEVKTRSVDLLNKAKEEQSNCMGPKVSAPIIIQMGFSDEWKKQFHKLFSEKTAEGDLFSAVDKDDVDLTEWLLDTGTNVNSRDYYKKTPLTHASKRGYADIIRVLVKYGASVNVKDYYNWFPLYYCAWKGHYNACVALLEAGANTDLHIPGEEKTPLHIAAKENYPDICKALIDHGANTESVDEYHWTPLFYCAYYGHLDVCKVLVDKGANINARSDNIIWGGTSLYWAKSRGYTAISQYLIQRGATE